MLDPSQTQQPNQNQSQDNSAQNAQNRKQQGTGFTNVSQILNANKGAGQKIGQTIGSGLQNQAGNIAKGIQQGQSQFQAGLNQSTENANRAIGQGKQLEKGANESDTDYQARIAGATPDSSNVDYSKIGQAVQNASYTGPSGLANANQVQAQAASAGALGRLAGNSSGQAQLIRNMVAKRGNYSTGQNALDSLLLGQGGQQAVQQGKASLSGIENQADVATQNAANQANASSTAVAANRLGVLQNIQNQLNGTGENGGITGINTQATNQAKAFSDDANRLKQLIIGKDANGNKLDPNQLSEHDMDLLNHPEQFGLKDQKLYTGDNTALESTMNSIANAINPASGGQYYQGNQQAAAQNLAKFLGDTNAAQQIGNSKYNTNVYQAGPNTLAAQQTALDSAKDLASKQRQSAESAKNAYLMAQNDPNLTQDVDSFLSGSPIPPDVQQSIKSLPTQAQQFAAMQNYLTQQADKNEQQIGNQKGIFDLLRSRLGLNTGQGGFNNPSTTPINTNLVKNR